MSKIKFITSDKKDIFIYRTSVENLFINEYLPDAPGEYVKVFIFGLMYAQFGAEIDSRTMANALGMSEKDVIEAYRYWNSKGLLRITREGNAEPQIEYVRQIDELYGNRSCEKSKSSESPSNTPEEAASNPQSDELTDKLEAVIEAQLRSIYDRFENSVSRPLTRNEITRLSDLIRIYGIEPDVLDFAIQYAKSLSRPSADGNGQDSDKCNIDFIAWQVKKWKDDGYEDVANIKIMLDERSLRSDYYKKIFSAMGFDRPYTRDDCEIMERWFDKWDYSIQEVLDACKTTAGKRERSLSYVNKVLENKLLEKGGINTRLQQATSQASEARQGNIPRRESSASKLKVSRDVLEGYYEELRVQGRRLYMTRVEEINSKLPEIVELSKREAELIGAMIKAGGSDLQNKHRIREEILKIQDKKRMVLTENGYPADYMDRKYKCDLCKDSGQTDEGNACSCRRARADEAYEWYQRINKS